MISRHARGHGKFSPCARKSCVVAGVPNGTIATIGTFGPTCPRKRSFNDDDNAGILQPDIDSLGRRDLGVDGRGAEQRSG